MMTTATMTAPPRTASETALLDRQAADVLAGRICSYAARQARAGCDLLVAVGEFDAGRGWGWSDGIKSAAHWLGWSCSMTPGTAREHIRVARALRRMPTVTEAFAAGQLSYSKVREVTRLVGVVDEAELCQLARYATASQLARTVSGFRAAAGSRIRAEERRLFRVLNRDGDSMAAHHRQAPTRGSRGADRSVATGPRSAQPTSPTRRHSYPDRSGRHNRSR